MAAASDIAQVRRNVDELTDVHGYSDEIIDALVDDNGVAGSSAIIWREKAARFSGLVTTNEGGTSHNFSDLSKAAKVMAEYWDGLAGTTTEEAAATGPIISTIVRET